MAEVSERARQGLADAVALRRQLHQNPEVGLELPRTRAAVLEALAGLDLEIRLSERTSGIVATLRGGRPGPTLLLRADMDALPMPEETGLEFSSREAGQMHACGHDAHTAMLVEAARILTPLRESFAGNLKLMFQPGEEGFFGARFMIEEGILGDDPSVDAAFAMHISPLLPPGTVAGRAGALFASADEFEIEIIGKGGHASMPHDAVDPIPVACELVQALQSFVTRRVNAFDPAVLTVARIVAGTTYNVIPETATLRGTIRAVSERARSITGEGLERLAKGIAAAHGLDARVRLERGYPVTMNHEGFTGFALDVARDLLGASKVIELPTPTMGAEDFSYLLQRVAGTMLILGVRPSDKARPAPCHSNRMLLDEDAMAAGIALHAAVALRLLDGEKREFSSPERSAGEEAQGRLTRSGDL